MRQSDRNTMALEIPIHANVKGHGKVWVGKGNYILVHNL